MTPRLALLIAMLGATGASARDLPADLRLRGPAVPAPGLEAALDEGRALLGAGNPVEAMAAFRAALALDAGNLAALNGLGVAYDRLGRADLARQQFELALALAPEAADIAYNLGWSLLRAGRDRDAIAPLQRAAASPDNRAAAAARRALAIIAARAEAQAVPLPAPPAPPRAVTARIDMVASGEAVLVLADTPRSTIAPTVAPAPAAPAQTAALAPPPARAAAVASVLSPRPSAPAAAVAPAQAALAEVASRLGDVADLTRPAEPVEPAAPPASAPAPLAVAPPPPASRPAAAALAARQAPAAPRPAEAPAQPAAPAPPVVIALRDVALPVLAARQPATLVLARAARRPPAAPSPRRPDPAPAPAPEPGAPAPDIRMAIARLERLIALIEAARA